MEVQMLVQNLFPSKKEIGKKNSHHSVLGALDTLIDNLPPCALQSTNIVAVRRSVAENLLQREVAMRKNGLLYTCALGRRNGIHLVNQWRRGIAVGPAAGRRRVDRGAGR